MKTLRTFLLSASFLALTAGAHAASFNNSFTTNNEANAAAYARRSGFDSATNGFTGTTFQLATNAYIKSATNIYFTAVGNVPTSTARFGQLTIEATGGNITVTNPPSWFTSDLATTRTLTNLNLMTVAVEVQPGVRTNAAFLQTYHP